MATKVAIWSKANCGPCNAIKPQIEKLKRDFGTVLWVHYDLERDAEYAAAQKIQKVPTVIVTRGEKPLAPALVGTGGGPNGVYNYVSEALQEFQEESDF